MSKKNKNKNKNRAPATPATPTVKPTPDKPKRGKKEVFKLVGNKDEKVYPFAVAVPEGFDFKTNKSLKKKDFKEDYLYFEHRAAECDFKAVAYREEAVEVKKLGSAKSRGSAKRLVKLQDKMAELKKQLTDQGVDVEKLLEDAAKEAEE